MGMTRVAHLGSQSSSESHSVSRCFCLLLLLAGGLGGRDGRREKWRVVGREVQGRGWRRKVVRER